MFLRCILIVLFYSFSINATAEESVWEKAKLSYGKASAAVSNYGTAVSSAYERTFGGRVDQGFSYVHGAIAGVSGDADGVKTSSNYREALVRMREEEGRKAGVAIEAANKAAKEAAQQATAAASLAGKKTVDASQQAALIAEINKGHSLTTDINGLIFKYNNINQTLSAIEQQLDKSMLNAYIQQKTARLLSSDNMCKATASCIENKGKNKAKFSFEDMKDIFPSSTSTRSAAGTKAVDPAATKK